MIKKEVGENSRACLFGGAQSGSMSSKALLRGLTGLGESTSRVMAIQNAS